MSKNGLARIVQFADDNKTLPDGSKVIYAENEEKIVIFQKKPFAKGSIYIYDRKTGRVYINGMEGTNQDKREMIQLGSYMLENSSDADMVTIDVHPKRSTPR